MRQALAAGLARLDAQLLLAERLGKPRSWLLANDDAVLAPADAAAVEAWVRRRSAGEPLAYLTGRKDFHGFTFAVSPDVLVPRPDTEVLVDWALELLAGGLAGLERPEVVDLGTGSGAVAIAIERRAPRVAMLATDASGAALDVARRNAAALQSTVAFASGSWWGATGTRRFHLAVSNPPYIAPDDPHLAALAHEPIDALVADDHGTAALRAIVDGAPAHLEPGGWLLLEHGHEQATVVQAMLSARGFDAVETRIDLGANPRCTGGRWRSS
nr:peptide chain release factor N(5)-glutamine methyltransferase [Schlegelella koreensis]